MFIDPQASHHPNPVRGGMVTNLIHISPLQGFWIEGVSVL
jgi:hypothetical protein